MQASDSGSAFTALYMSWGVIVDGPPSNSIHFPLDRLPGTTVVVPQGFLILVESSGVGEWGHFKVDMVLKRQNFN